MYRFIYYIRKGHNTDDKKHIFNHDLQQNLITVDLLIVQLKEAGVIELNSACNELYSGCVLDHYDIPTCTHHNYTYFNKAILFT